MNPTQTSRTVPVQVEISHSGAYIYKREGDTVKRYRIIIKKNDAMVTSIDPAQLEKIAKAFTDLLKQNGFEDSSLDLEKTALQKRRFYYENHETKEIEKNNASYKEIKSIISNLKERKPKNDKKAHTKTTENKENVDPRAVATEATPLKEEKKTKFSIGVKELFGSKPKPAPQTIDDVAGLIRKAKEEKKGLGLKNNRIVLSSRPQSKHTEAHNKKLAEELLKHVQADLGEKAPLARDWKEFSSANTAAILAWLEETIPAVIGHNDISGSFTALKSLQSNLKRATIEDLYKGATTLPDEKLVDFLIGTPSLFGVTEDGIIKMFQAFQQQALAKPETYHRFLHVLNLWISHDEINGGLYKSNFAVMDMIQAVREQSPTGNTETDAELDRLNQLTFWGDGEGHVGAPHVIPNPAYAHKLDSFFSNLKTGSGVAATNASMEEFMNDLISLQTEVLERCGVPGFIGAKWGEHPESPVKKTAVFYNGISLLLRNQILTPTQRLEEVKDTAKVEKMIRFCILLRDKLIEQHQFALAQSIHSALIEANIARLYVAIDPKTHKIDASEVKRIDDLNLATQRGDLTDERYEQIIGRYPVKIETPDLVEKVRKATALFSTDMNSKAIKEAYEKTPAEQKVQVFNLILGAVTFATDGNKAILDGKYNLNRADVITKVLKPLLADRARLKAPQPLKIEGLLETIEVAGKDENIKEIQSLSDFYRRLPRRAPQAE